MSSYFFVCRTIVIGVFVVALMTSLSFGADPKIVRASHAQAAKSNEKESVGPKNEDLSYSTNWPEPPDTAGMLWRLCLGTFGVLALCVGSLWLGKPWLQKLQVKSTGNPDFFIEATLPTGNRAMLYLVRVGQTQLVAGTDASGLKALITIPPTFKEVLDQQVPEIEDGQIPPARSEATPEKPAIARSAMESILERPFAGHSLFRPGQKE